MKKPGVLIISKTRPSRTWNFANRIVREIPDAEICGVIQCPLRSIPLVQQRIAAGETQAAMPAGWQSGIQRSLRPAVKRVSDWALWFAHGCPAVPGGPKKFTVEMLVQECARAGWPLVVTSSSYIESALAAVRRTNADLLIFLGAFQSLGELPISPPSGCIRATIDDRANASNGLGRGASICVEHFSRDSQASSAIASVNLPWQPYDGLLGFTLKTDLIADDLLVQTAASLFEGGPESASKAVPQWADRILAPCLGQLLQGSTTPLYQNEFSRKRCRSAWKLFLDSLLLCSPWIVARNWYRRWSRNYPILILAHHLVSDRSHRMAVPTEVFWDQILFLQDHYRIVSISEAAKLLRSGAVRVPTVTLTFDDGYADNFLGLRAVANETGIPATLFITTEPVETQREFEHDRQNGITGFLPLTWNQIRYWSTRGVEFGSHTRTHFDCGSCDLETLKSEIVGSREDLESKLGSPANFFAFPYGKPQNISLEAMNLAESTYSHFASFFGGEGCVGEAGNQSHLLRKVFYSSRWELELELQSVFEQADALKNVLFQRGKHQAPAGSLAIPAVPALAPSLQSLSPKPQQPGIFSETKDH